MALNTLKDLLIHELRDLYSAETQLLDALPKMVEAASHEDLKEAFRNHLHETQNQKKRLTQVFSILKQPADSKRCLAMEGLIKEAQDLIAEPADISVKDAALIAAAQRVEHYEMAGYGTAVAYADLLDYEEIEDLLKETLDEEGNANKTLNKIATGGLFSSGLNKEASIPQRATRMS
ncbi:MAG: ferritin-like domain-containing protein [Rhodothermales bacterium]|nr:ferritin-like domain-containing protein [Rhodothermales bacterium]